MKKSKNKVHGIAVHVPNNSPELHAVGSSPNWRNDKHILCVACNKCKRAKKDSDLCIYGGPFLEISQR